MNDTEKAALEKRIDELCQENERLRELADGAMNEADRLTHDAAALQIENAKLRMLCADMWEAIKTHKRINFAQLLRFGERVSELEIEVPS